MAALLRRNEPSIRRIEGHRRQSRVRVKLVAVSAPLLLVCAMAIMGSSVAASFHGPPGAGHSGLVVDVVQELDVGAMWEPPEYREWCSAATNRSMRSGTPLYNEHFRTYPAENAFEFWELDFTIICGEMRHGLATPTAERDLIVTFSADRRIDDAEARDQLAPNERFHQELRFYNPAGELVQALPLAEPTEGSFAMRPFQITVALPAGVDQIAWYFEDEGRVITEGPLEQDVSYSRAAFASKVMAPEVRYRDVAVPEPEHKVAHTSIRNNTILRSLVWEVPGHIAGLGVVTAFKLPFPADLELQAIRLSGGEVVPASDYVVVGETGVRELWYHSPEAEPRPADEMASPPAQNATFRVEFLERQILPTAAAPPVIEESLVPLAVALVAAPAPVSAWAAQGVARYRRLAVGPYLKTGVLLTAALTIVAAVYAILVWQALAVVGLERLARVPLSPAAWIIYLQAVVVLAAFVVLGVAGGRYLTDAMQMDLERRAQRQSQLEVALAELERSNHELAQFASVASHDLREPLRKVSQYGTLLQRRFPDALDEPASKYVATMVESAARMQTLIADLLDLSRVGHAARAVEPIHLTALVKDILADFEVSLQTADATVHRSHLPIVVGNPSEWRQALQNLISNAIKFRHPGRRLKIRIEAVPLPAGAEPPEFWRIAVRDNGIGVQRRHQQRIFDVFQRLHGRHEYEGNGIGLAIVRKIAERHGGRAWVESDGHSGSCFYLEVPHAAGIE